MKQKRNNWLQRVALVLVDAFCLYIAYWLAFYLRFDMAIPQADQRAFYESMPFLIPLNILIFYIARFYNTIWEFASLEELLQLIYGTGIASLLNVFIGYVILPRRFPRTVYVIGAVLMLCLIGCVRFSFRYIHRIRKKSMVGSQDDTLRVMVVGAGEMGSMVIKELKTSTDCHGQPVVVVDDSPAKIGTRIHGISVYGGREQIPRLVVKYDVDEIILAIPSASAADKQEIINICTKTNIRLKTVPALYEMFDDPDQSFKLRDVNIVDLLGRDEIELDNESISGYIKDRVVLVTGGGGSIGSELCRQLAHFSPKKIVIFDIYENNAYDLQNELIRTFKGRLNLEVIIGSVRDKERVKDIFGTYKPDVIFHAAAHKHVPLMESSPGEAVKNNVFGTWNVAEAADKFGAKLMVMISTDKAVNPTNVMGATKRICELVIQYFSRHSKTEYVAVRFGNVLGSNGSVIPLFKKQIEAGGPVTVTHPEITRFFMTIPEASRLVIQAGGMAHGGEIFVLDMGRPVKIVDLAKNLITLSGLKPDRDIKIVFTGLRPGEKLYEELLLESEGGCEKTSHELIYIGKPIEFNEQDFLSNMDALRQTAGVDNQKMMETVARLVPTYEKQNSYE